MKTKYALLWSFCSLLSVFGNAQSYSSAFIDINPGATGSSVEELTVDRNDLYMYMNAESDAMWGRELHRTFHTWTSVNLYRDNYAGTPNGDPEDLTLFYNYNQIYYDARNNSGDDVVFSSSSNNPEQTQELVSQFTSCGNRMYYIGTDAATAGREIWYCTTAAGSASIVFAQTSPLSHLRYFRGKPYCFGILSSRYSRP
ncbi:hypothetical protein N9355_00145 [Crocinitomicaceae bacterium]|nr:hypothetical protein [Crocinitomicaceae bacterium]